MQTPERFEKFYYTKVGMGEACGCAERIIDVYEFNRKAGANETRRVSVSRPRWRGLKSFALRYGLISRPGGR